ncbi:MAG TPA: carbohydrate ABC transporter permease [Solirubrobacteraceae bacterium]|jgi:ABC-type glycerol-3-phosphate transport system permease component
MSTQFEVSAVRRSRAFRHPGGAGRIEPGHHAAKRRQRVDLVLWGGVTVILLSVVLPLLLVLKISLEPPSALNTFPHWSTLLPHSLTFSHYTTIFKDSQFLGSLKSSLIIAGATTIVTLLIGGPAAYALSRLRFRFRTTIMAGILAISFFPMVAIIAPMFIQFKELGLLNSYFAVIITDTVFVLPLAIWILAAFFRQLPPDLERAAKVDGASTLQAFWHVIVPLSAPGVVSAAILTFISTWNEYLFANTFLFDASKWPVTVLIPNFEQSRLVPDYGAQAAAALVVTIPILLLVLFFQRRIVSGLTAGAVVG